MDLFRIVLPWENEATKFSKPAPGGSAPRQKIVFGVLMLVMLNLALAIWFLKGFTKPGARSPAMNNQPAAPGSRGRIGSLAVKPLDDISGDTNQAYFSDGMTEALC